MFNRVHLVGDTGSSSCVDEGSGLPGPMYQFCPTGRSFPMIGFALTVGGNPFGTSH